MTASHPTTNLLRNGSPSITRSVVSVRAVALMPLPVLAKNGEVAFLGIPLAIHYNFTAQDENGTCMPIG